MLLRKVGGKIPAITETSNAVESRPKAVESPNKEVEEDDDFWNMRESNVSEKVNLGDMSISFYKI